MISLVLFGALTRADALAYPAPLQVARPDPEPALPREIDVFTPPIDEQASPPTAPTFAAWTRTAGPNDTFVVTGDRLSNCGGVEEGKDTQIDIYAQSTHSNGVLRAGSIQRLDGQKAAITVSNMPAWAMYFVWPRNSAGYGRPIALNRTESSWLGPNLATRGQATAVYGRNLSKNNGTGKAWIYLLPAVGGRGRWAKVNSVNPYRVEFIVPWDLPNGDYEVWTHNGHGGHYGWSGPLKLSIDDGLSWTAVEFDVVRFGAVPNDTVNDADAIDAALAAAAKSPRSTVYFPAGVYYTNRGFHVPSNVRWRGDGRRRSIIALKGFNPGSGAGGYAMFFDEEVVNDQGRMIRAAQSNVEFRDLTIDANHSYEAGRSLIYLRGTNRVRFANVSVKAAGYGPFDLHGAENVTLSNCEIVGKTTFLGSGKQLFIDHVDYFGTNDTGTLWYSWGRSQLSMTNSTARDLDTASETGWSQGRFFTSSGNWTSTRDVYLGDNATFNLSVRPGYGAPGSEAKNTGEQFLWEQNVTRFRARARDATATTVTLPGLMKDLTGEEAIVISGKGLGQHREITAYDPTTETVRVKPAWDVLPDETSELILENAAVRQNIYHNVLDAKGYAATEAQHNATAGVQIFGGGYEFVVAKNTFNQLRGGSSIWAVASRSQGTQGEVQPSFFNLYSHNYFRNVRHGLAIYLGMGDFDRDSGLSILGVIFRRNMIKSSIEEGIILAGSLRSAGRPVDMNVVEHNAVLNVTRGITIHGETARSGEPIFANTIVYGNRFARGRAPFRGSFAARFDDSTRTILRANGWADFEMTIPNQAPHATGKHRPDCDSR